MAGKNAEPKGKASEFKTIVFIAYFFTWVSGLIVFIMSNKDKNNRFHALQAIFLGIAITILSFIPFLGILAFFIWIYAIYIGYMGAKGKKILIPVLGEYAEKYSA
ncbi:MAG: hypothetical protein M1331_00180 [Candidatus Marsarchaeota archaeon]|nr:hypothetical protein [Candidatus Marsarchaeota archaeon]